MPIRISSPIAIAAAFVIWAIGLDLQADAARANDCLAAPNASAPQGQHWYYRIDRSSHRKCWYLHAILPVLHRVVIKQVKHYGLLTEAGVAIPGSLEGSAPSSPDVRTFFGKLQPTLVVRATSEKPSLQIAHDSPSIPRESGPDLLRRPADANISDDTEGTPESSIVTEEAGVSGALRLIILLLAPGLAVAGFLLHVVIKMVSERPIYVPETARVERQFFHDRSEPRGRHDRLDDHHEFCFADPRSREHSTDQHAGIKEPPSALTRRSKTRSERLAATLAVPLRPNQMRS